MDVLRWPIELIGEILAPLPRSLITRKPFDANGALDSMTALLLPSAGVAPPDHACNLPVSEGECLGIWMGTGFPISARLGTGCWVSNFPSSAVYGDTFARSLSEVGLGPAQERAHLAAFKADGARILLTLIPGQPIEDVTAPDPDACLIVLRSDADIERLRSGYLDHLRHAIGATTPVILHGGPENHLPRSPETLGLQGLLQTPAYSASRKT